MDRAACSITLSVKTRCKKPFTSFFAVESRPTDDDHSVPPPAKSPRSSQPSECGTSAVTRVSCDIAELACGNKVAKTPFDKLNECAHIFRPPESSCFPVNQMYGRNRQFRFQWRDHSWLAYSPSKDGVYCIPCVMFAADKSSFGQLVTSPLINFARAATTLNEHAKQATHLKAVASMAEAEYRFKQCAPSINQQLTSQASQVMSKNTAKLISIMKTKFFCAKQNIALRGHRNEGGISLSDSDQMVENLGNFLALLRFRAESGDGAP